MKFDLDKLNGVKISSLFGLSPSGGYSVDLGDAVTMEAKCYLSSSMEKGTGLSVYGTEEEFACSIYFNEMCFDVENAQEVYVAVRDKYEADYERVKTLAYNQLTEKFGVK